MVAKKPEILQRQVIASSRLFKIEQIELRFANGAERTYERLCNRGHGAVMMVPMLDAEHVLLIREYAAGTENYEVGLPKGLIEANEEPLAAANRELREETGYAAGKLTPLTTLFAAPGYLSSSMQVVLAEALYHAPLPGDEPEAIEVFSWPLANICELINRGDISEARSIAALFIVRERLLTTLQGT